MTFCSACQTTLAVAALSACPGCGAARPASGWPVDLRLGCVVAGNQYRVLRRLGAGGFGTVYLVETVVGGLRRALKVLHAEWAHDASTRERFVNEAVVLEQLNHPNVARCYAAGTLEGPGHDLFLLLELIEGVPLSSMPLPLDPLRAVRLAKQVASGLVAAHAARVLHRDLKPHNVLVTAAGSPAEQVKLVDFGIAGALDGEQTRRELDATSAHPRLGTPLYMAPELVEGTAAPDARADLWQLGALLYVMLTGELPFTSPDGTLGALVEAHRRYCRRGPKPGSVRPEVSRWESLDTFVATLLATDPEARPRSAAHACEELARVEHQLAPGAELDDEHALLEALCATPSEQAWWSICRFLGSREDAARLMGAAESLLADWPDALRCAPLQWWEAVRRGEGHPLWPIARALDLSGRGLSDSDVEDLVRNPSLATITCLSLAGNLIGISGVEALAASKHLSAITSLDLSDNRISGQGAWHLANSQTLRRLARLHLAGNAVGPKGAAALASGGLALTMLDLAGNGLEAEGATALAGGTALTGVVRLVLSDNRIGSDGMSALAMSRTLRGLADLDVSDNEIGVGGAAALALSATVGRLERLSLARNTLGLEGLELLLSSHRFSALEALDVSSNALGAQGAMLLASSPFARRLRWLDVSDNRLGDAGLASLLGAPFLSGLRTLRAAQNGITGAGIALLASAPPELEELDVSSNAIGATGAAAMVQVLKRLRLRALSLSDCGVPAEGLALLFEAGPADLRTLAVAGNDLGPVGVSALRKVPGGPALFALDVSRNALGAEGLALLANWPALRTLRSLQADSNAVGDGAAVRVADALSSLGSLEHLRLRDNGLGPRFATALAASRQTTHLARLDLGMNALGDAGASALAQGPGWPSLRALCLDRNEISLGAASTVLLSPRLPLLHRVGLGHNALSGLVDLYSLAHRKIELLESSFATASRDGAAFAERFYERLFARYPAVKPLFAHTSMRRQHHHLFAALGMVIEHLRAPEEVEAQLRLLGERHAGYRVYPSHYQAVTVALIDTLRESLGGAWDEDLEAAWHDGLEAIAAAMIKAQQDAAARSQPTAKSTLAASTPSTVAAISVNAQSRSMA